MSHRSYYVYVIALAPDVLQNTRFKRRNPGVVRPRACVYVGSSFHPPERRFEQHLNGYRSNRFVERYGLELRPRLYDRYNPIDSRAEAEKLERYLAERLQKQGYAVWTG
jgi:Uri superfamily endonuclease